MTENILVTGKREDLIFLANHFNCLNKGPLFEEKTYDMTERETEAQYGTNGRKYDVKLVIPRNENSAVILKQAK